MHQQIIYILTGTFLLMTSSCLKTNPGDLVVNEYDIQVEGKDWSGINYSIASHENIDSETKHYFVFYNGTYDGKNRQSIGLVNLPLQSGSYLMHDWGNSARLPFIDLSIMDSGGVTPLDMYTSKMDSVSYIKVIDYIKLEKRFMVEFEATLHSTNQNINPLYADSIQVSGYIDFTH